MTPVDLPIKLLRAFVTVSDLGGFTKAAKALHRTQPAISLQMKRLEELLGEKLFVHEGGTVHLTSHGQVLAGFARQILRLNDETLGRFRRTKVQGSLRIGLPTDYAVSFLQGIVTDFARDSEAVEFSIQCELSRYLLEQLHADQLDIVVALIGEGNEQYLVRAWEEQPIWVRACKTSIHKSRPLPLVSHPEGCEYRNRMIGALNNAGIDWRIAYCSPGITGLQNAVSAALGVSVLTQKTLLNDMCVVTVDDGFPVLEKIRIGLFYKHPRQSAAGLALIEHLVANLDSAANGDFMPSQHPLPSHAFMGA